MLIDTVVTKTNVTQFFGHLSLTKKPTQLKMPLSFRERDTEKN